MKASKSQNRLAREKSPYLLQHAGNPVDWYPWGDEAFAAAKRRDVPVFLSVGYATCHWCHVMERESFEDPEVARILNDAFVCVKVDREERPDVDQTYMQVCQMMTGSGGWPLTVLLTPDRRPFFAGTYIPKTSRFGRVGLLDFIPRVTDAWRNQRAQLGKSADDVVRHLLESASPPAGGAVEISALGAGFQQLAALFDAEHGGFGTAPKFPTPHQLVFLLRYWHRTGDDDARRMVHSSLAKLRASGLFDHVGFGFHRYSTDAEWFLPHFEKMLYDQAGLLTAYAEAYQAFGDERFAQTAREIVGYVERDLRDPAGGFYCAEDADSEGVEGKFYLWTWDELEDALEAADLRWVADHFDVRPDGNVHDEATHAPSGRNHLRFVGEDPDPAAWRSIREKLLAWRARRVRPLRDDKILTDWNGLMIAALARAARSLGDPKIAELGLAAAQFIEEHLRAKDGRLLHRFRDGEARIHAFLDDHVFLTHGLIELFEATGRPSLLERAIELQETTLREFWDHRNGGFFFTSERHEGMLARQKEYYDGAVPAGNSIAALNLVRLARLTGRAEWEERANKALESAPPQAQRHPAGFTQLLIAADFALGPTSEIVVADGIGFEALRRAAHHPYAPRTTLILKGRADAAAISTLAPFTREMDAVQGRAAAYVCQGFRCELPVTQPERLEERLRAATALPDDAGQGVPPKASPAGSGDAGPRSGPSRAGRPAQNHR